MSSRIYTLETTYLGGLLNDESEVYEAIKHFEDYEWQTSGCAELFEIIAEATKSGIAVDASIIDCTARKEISGALVGDVLINGPVAHNMAFYRKRLLSVKNHIKTNKAAAGILKKTKDGNLEITEEVNTILGASVDERETLVDYDKAFMNTIDQIESDLAKGTGAGFKTGWNEFDKVSSGFHSKDLVIVAARPSMGKTAFALNILNKAVFEKKKCVFFSLEMDTTKVIKRLMSMNMRINGMDLISLDLSDRDLDKVAAFGNKIKPLRNYFYISDLMGTCSQIREQTRQAKAKMGGVDFIFVDYLQLIKSRGTQQNREREVAMISSDLKQLARDNDACVVAVAQLSRNVDSRPIKKPLMSDLRDSGSIEQDADQILLLYRDDYYNDDSPDPGLTEVNIAKNRNGTVGTVNLRFTAPFMTFDV